ncbi:radical SAM/Cys-rich protein [Plasticicumulans lactativorans]|uniref:Radical SAM/Cys-rich protein n=1 Tax=Plasticicumulans lactativorans TaxID=1133106 RepID=A0A4R2L7X9_9GAMM|nr:arsenosugar biosynthesis radical SAM (seleno)protein ArsS [Plasticicumulans lactativorans]TCO81447.1 radical SAM/Cys-rich protein [Plasticicumulans lactativorans]
MHDVLPRLRASAFPALTRARLETLQVNLGYRCNQACLHCHVNAGPKRTEQMDRATVDAVLELLDASGARNLDITGGAPELNPHFRHLVCAARARDVQVMDRCNLTILLEPGFEDLAAFLAAQGVHVVASLPCYLETNVDGQRGDGVFARSIAALQRLNALGYAAADTRLELDLVYNPTGPYLPPPQAALEADYRRELGVRHGVRFNRLYTLANMPIQRFGSTLISRGAFDAYLRLLRDAHRDENLVGVMCRTLVSVAWDGSVYDCDFNQMLGLPLRLDGRPRVHVRDLLGVDLDGNPIMVAGHCYGCTAGQGSSCGGALS